MSISRLRRRYGAGQPGVSVLLAVAATCGSAVAGPTCLSEALQACTQEHDDGLRLACFDREMARSMAVAQKSMGLTSAQVYQMQNPGAAQAPKPQEVSSSVAAIQERSDGRSLITLSDGEVWLQSDAHENLGFKVGDAVKVKPGLMGSYFIYSPSGTAIRVKRLK